MSEYYSAKVMDDLKYKRDKIGLQLALSFFNVTYFSDINFSEIITKMNTSQNKTEILACEYLLNYGSIIREQHKTLPDNCYPS